MKEFYNPELQIVPSVFMEILNEGNRLFSHDRTVIVSIYDLVNKHADSRDI